MKVLVVTSRFPLPPWRGNQVRTVEWLRALEGCERAVVCPSPVWSHSLEQLDSICENTATYHLNPALRLLSACAALVSGRPIQESLYRVASARRAVRGMARRLRPDVVVVQMVRCGWALEEVRTEVPSAAVVFDAIDSMALHFERAGRHAAAVTRPLWSVEASRCRWRERELAAHAEISTAVSSRDLAAVQAPPGRGRVVPVAGRDMGGASLQAGRPTVLLSGNLGYRPTVVAARWFARHVWPALLERVPEARWVLAGARPARSIRSLARLPGVEVHGDVSELAPYFASATVAIAPMASGSGVPMKVLEAWSASVPVVADPWCAAGIEGHGSGGVILASTAADWIACVGGMLSDPQAARRVGGHGHRVWCERHRFAAVAEAVVAAVEAAVVARTGGLAVRTFQRP